MNRWTCKLISPSASMHSLLNRGGYFDILSSSSKVPGLHEIRRFQKNFNASLKNGTILEGIFTISPIIWSAGWKIKQKKTKNKASHWSEVNLAQDKQFLLILQKNLNHKADAFGISRPNAKHSQNGFTNFGIHVIIDFCKDLSISLGMSW